MNQTCATRRSKRLFYTSLVGNTGANARRIVKQDAGINRQATAHREGPDDLNIQSGVRSEKSALLCHRFERRKRGAPALLYTRAGTIPPKTFTGWEKKRASLQKRVPVWCYLNLTHASLNPTITRRCSFSAHASTVGGYTIKSNIYIRRRRYGRVPPSPRLPEGWT